MGTWGICQQNTLQKFTIKHQLTKQGMTHFWQKSQNASQKSIIYVDSPNLQSVPLATPVHGRDLKPGQMKVVVFIVSHFGEDRHRCDEHGAVCNYSETWHGRGLEKNGETCIF